MSGTNESGRRSKRLKRTNEEKKQKETSEEKDSPPAEAKRDCPIESAGWNKAHMVLETRMNTHDKTKSPAPVDYAVCILQFAYYLCYLAQPGETLEKSLQTEAYKVCGESGGHSKGRHAVVLCVHT